MGKKPFIGLVSLVWAGMTLTGCECCKNCRNKTYNPQPTVASRNGPTMIGGGNPTPPMVGDARTVTPSGHKLTDPSASTGFASTTTPSIQTTSGAGAAVAPMPTTTTTTPAPAPVSNPTSQTGLHSTSFEDKPAPSSTLAPRMDEGLSSAPAMPPTTATEIPRRATMPPVPVTPKPTSVDPMPSSSLPSTSAGRLPDPVSPSSTSQPLPSLSSSNSMAPPPMPKEPPPPASEPSQALPKLPPLPSQ